MSVVYNTKTYRRDPMQFPGSYETRKIEIDGVDVSEQAIEVDVFESLHGSMTGQMLMVDTTNLLASLPIIGGETLDLHFDDHAEQFRMRFKIFKVSDRSQPNMSTLQYKLHFCSEELYLDSHTFVSKAYDNVNHEDCIKELLQEHLKSNKQLLLAPTTGPKCFIIPRWSPLAAASWLAGRSKSSRQDYGGGTFTFFETYEGYSFLALDNLFDDVANRPYCELSYDPVRKSVDMRTTFDKRMPEDVLRFEDFSVAKSSDVLDNALQGMYHNQVRFVDVTKKEPRDSEFNYLTDFKSGKHLRGGVRNDAFPVLRERDSVATGKQGMLRVIPRHKGLFTNEKDDGDGAPSWFASRVSQLQQTEMFVVRGALPGHIGLKAGHIVRFSYPDNGNRSIRTEYKEDLYYTGQYLVTAVRRSFRRDKFFLFVELVKDSLSLSLGGILV